jgi:peptidoglycan/xylan/chitin deacetylase (PgdA/CDA1 family)
MSLTIVMYHYVRDLRRSRYPLIKGRSEADFVRQLDHIAANFTVVRAESIIAAANGGPALPENAAWLTFDDGYRDHYDVVFPLLHARGWQGSFFAPARAIAERRLLDVNKVHFILAVQPDPTPLIAAIRDFVAAHRGEDSIRPFDDYWTKLATPFRWDTAETIFVKRMLQHALPEALRGELTERLFDRFVDLPAESFAAELYASAEQLKLMVRCGMYVGSHGFSHVWLNNVTQQQQAEEIDRSLDFLDSLGAPTRDWIMCYPYGAYDASVLEHLRKRACAIGLTSRVAIADLATDPILELPRLDTNDVPLGPAH